MFFFFQAEDGIRDKLVTGVQTCALPISFLDGIQQWAVVGYDGVTPIVRAHVAAAVRRRGPDRRPRTADEAARELAITRLAARSAPVRRAPAEADVEIVGLAADATGQPGRALRAGH